MAVLSYRTSLTVKIAKDGTYIESGFKNDKPCGKILIVKPNGTYFEGNLDANNRNDPVGNPGKVVGIFRNPVLKRQSMIQKDPNRSKQMCFGKNAYGYNYFSNKMRYKGLLGKGTSLFLFSRFRVRGGTQVRGGHKEVGDRRLV